MTAAELHRDDDDDDGTHFTDRTDDDSFLEDSSLKMMMKNSIQMLDSLTDEMKEFTKDSSGSESDGTSGVIRKPRVVTPSSVRSGKTDHGSLKDMTISVSFDSNTDKFSKTEARSTLTTPVDASECLRWSSSPLSTPLVSPMHAPVIQDVAIASKMPCLDDLPAPKETDETNEDQQNDTRKRNQNDYNEEDDGDSFSLDDSLANEMNALKEVALELRKELQSTDMHAVQEAIERIGNSQDPRIKAVLESEDKKIIRRILDDEIQKNEPQNTVLRYIYKATMNTLTQEETTHLLIAVAVLVWSIVIRLVYQAISMDLL